MSYSLTRRSFSRAAAAALAGGALGAPAAHAAAAAQTAAAAPESAEAEAKLARVVALYGDRLSAAQRDRLRRTIAGHVAMLEPIRAARMENGDPPATVLRLVRGETHGQ